eukprot:scaffold377445_cov39-Prasinocladus_malaysianus.AAC.1
MSTERLRECVRELEDTVRCMQNELDSCSEFIRQKEEALSAAIADRDAAEREIEVTATGADKAAEEAREAREARDALVPQLEETRWRLRQVEKQLSDDKTAADTMSTYSQYEFTMMFNIVTIGRLGVVLRVVFYVERVQLKAELDSLNSTVTETRAEADSTAKKLQARTQELQDTSELLEKALTRADAAESEAEVLKLREQKRMNSLETAEGRAARQEKELHQATARAEQSEEKLLKAEDRIRELFDRTQ